MTRHCQHCDKEFATPSSLKRHIIAKHTGIRHEHPCASCGAHFARKDALHRHISSRHKRELMERCHFCLEHFRKDYFDRHESTCAKKYCAKVCRNAELTEDIRHDQSNEINRRPLIRREILPDAEPIPAAENDLRVVHEIDLDTRLAAKALYLVFLHCWDTGNVESCLETIAISLRLGVPIDGEDHFLIFAEGSHCDDLVSFANCIGRYVRGETAINHPNVNGLTMMDQACIQGAADLLEPLFWRGAEFGKSALLYAIESGSSDTVRFCLALGADPNGYALDRDLGHNPLTLATASSKTSHIVPLLIEYGATVFMRHVRRRTPLHLAALQADVGVTRVLLAHESSVEFLDAIDEFQYRALDYAVKSMLFGTTEDQVLEVLSALLDAGASTITGRLGDSALNFAAERDCAAIIRLLLNGGKESPQKAVWLNEALVSAVHGGAEGAFQILIEAGAKLDDKTFFDEALRYKSLKIVERFLKAGARVDLVGYETLEFLFDGMNGHQPYMTPHSASARWELLLKYLEPSGVSAEPWFCSSPNMMSIWIQSHTRGTLLERF